MEMLMIKKIHFILAIAFLISAPLSIKAQPSQVPDASWGSVDHFKYSNSGESETFKKIKLLCGQLAWNFKTFRYQHIYALNFIKQLFILFLK